MSEWMREWINQGTAKKWGQKEGSRVPCKRYCGVETGPSRSEELLMDSSTFSSDPLYSKAIGS